jgi:hypothetical protein
VQSPDDRHDHDPPRLRTLVCFATGVAALAVPSTAVAAQYATLPSPVAPLSAAPPLGGGAFSSSESTRHRVDAVTSVRVAVDQVGVPFAIAASQSLDVRVAGDYFFTIGAPLRDVEALPGSDSAPGLRSASIVWAGFNPGRRTLKARAVLDLRPAASALPLQIEVSGSSTTLVNATAATVSTFSADVEQAPLLRYYEELRAASAPVAGAAYLTSPARRTNVTVRAPLEVSGTVGGRRISALVTDRLVVHAVGAVRLTVRPVRPSFPPAAGLSGRALLARVTAKLLTLARVRQYEAFLGNPDPTGRNATSYRYVTAVRPRRIATAEPVPRGRDWTATAAIAVGVAAALGVATVAWSRS